MRPAFLAVAAAMRADEWPSPAAVAAMMVESGNCTPDEAADLACRYGASLPAPSGEAGILDALRSFSIREDG